MVCAKPEFEGLSSEAIHVPSLHPAALLQKMQVKVPGGEQEGSKSYKVKLKERVSWENWDQIKINHEL